MTSRGTSITHSAVPTPFHGARLHPTCALLDSLASLAHSSLQDHINDYADAHRWIDSFFDKLEHNGPAAGGLPRPAMSELMKTPGRRRVVGANSTNALHASTTAKKDPVATLLFPVPPSAALSPGSVDKENSPASPAKASSPRRLLSPIGSGKGKGKGKAAAPLSPLRLGSPRGVLSPNRATSTPARSAAPTPPAPEPVVFSHDFAAPADEVDDIFGGGVHDLSNVMEEDEEEDEIVAVAPTAAPVEVQDAPGLTEEEKANLSIIGEEEEDEDDEDVSAVTAPSTQAGAASQPSTILETQFSQPFAPSAQAELSVASPHPRTVSGASSVAQEADSDTSVPLNDAPSALRSAHGEGLSSSVSSNTRTPGNTTRFGLGSYSAAKLGTSAVGLGSSPPVAPSTTGKALANNRTSTGGNGGRLNFVGLPKKSLGLGLGLGRTWNASVASTSVVSDSQPSSQSSAAATQPVSQSMQPSLGELAQTGTTTATGATKRKSLDGPDAANKTAKLSPPPAAKTAQEQEQEEANKRREALKARMQSMQARQSTVTGRTSNVAGPFSANLFASTKAHGPASSLFLPISSTSTNKPAATSSSAIVASTSSYNVATPAAEVSNPLSRRPSVMERVKSFEQTSTLQDHLHPPSPSKIPAAFNRVVSPGSALSPRGITSPPASPRPLTRSATSNLPLATFGSPKPQQLAPSLSTIGLGSPKLGAMHRSPPPTSAAALPSPVPATIASVLSPPAPAEVKSQITSPRSASAAKFVPPTITVKPTLPPVIRSTTPEGSPPPVEPVAAKVQQALPAAPVEEQQDELVDDDDDEDEEEVSSIRAINASIPPAAVAAAQAKAKADAAEAERARQQREADARKAAEQAARDLEEQEAEREREQMLQKRLPSLPEPKPLTPQESDEEDDEEEDEDEPMSERAQSSKAPASVVSTATKENLAVKASPSKIAMPGSFGAALVSAAKESRAAMQEDEEDGDDEEEEEGEIEDDDRTTMSVLSTATTSTFNYTASSQGPFKPVTAHKSQLSKQGSQTSLASSVSSSALGLNRSISNGASNLKKPEPKVKSIQRAAGLAKKEKEERDRKAALKEEKRAALDKKKQEDERKIKVETLEKKRKEREEAATKAKASAMRGVKPKAAEEEPAKKRKIEPEPKTRPEIKKVAQPTRPLTASTSTQRMSSLAQSQGRPGAMGPPSALNKSVGPSSTLNKSAGPAGMLNKSAGAGSMVGQKFMSSQIRLPEIAQTGPSRAPTVPKPFGVSSQSAMRPPQQPHHTPAAKADPEPYQELPEIDSEYSDSDDEAHEKKVASFPRWAQSPALAHALLEQRKVNPDDIFGPIPQLSIQEIFRSSSSAARLRARTSSAQWEGTDALSQTDLARYHRVMGFTNGEGGASSQHR
ncbi:hypothetical protein JCM10207_006584 [Rhodosporidiobolus poonsookiae]